MDVGNAGDVGNIHWPYNAAIRYIHVAQNDHRPATPAFPTFMWVRKCMEQFSASAKPEKTATAVI
jgi:hypothetical protein